jgi:hypothetical protein
MTTIRKKTSFILNWAGTCYLHSPTSVNVCVASVKQFLGKHHHTPQKIRITIYNYKPRKTKVWASHNGNWYVDGNLLAGLQAVAYGYYGMTFYVNIREEKLKKRS